MSSQYRKTWLLILLAVLAGHALLMLHVNSHVATDQQACELCTHYSGLDHAPAPSVPDAFPLTFVVSAASGNEPFTLASLVADLRTRGPPGPVFSIPVIPRSAVLTL